MHASFVLKGRENVYFNTCVSGFQANLSLTSFIRFIKKNYCKRISKGDQAFRLDHESS